MRIDGINSNPNAAAHQMNKSKPAKETAPTDTLETQNTETVGSKEKTKGVLRLLQAGHFKGVADVRLRINFFDEIQALEAQNLKTTAAGSFETFNQTAQEQADALKESGLLSDDQLAAVDAFLQNLQTSQNTFMDDPDASVQSLVQQLQGELDNLLALLNPPEPVPVPTAEQQEIPQEPTEPQPGEMPADSAEPADPVEAPVFVEAPQAPEPNPLQQLVESFRQTMQQAIDNLQSELNGTSALPPISEPSGGGRAFDKFMDTYESMLNGTATDLEEPLIMDAEEVAVPVETMAITELIEE